MKPANTRSLIRHSVCATYVLLTWQHAILLTALQAQPISPAAGETTVLALR
jgi:hypothetical protein